METIQITINGNIATVALDRGRSNAMNHQMVNELADTIKELEKNDAVGGVILTGKSGFFSSGVDLIEAYGYDEQQIKAFWVDFFKLQTTLISFKKPLIAAISGHSPAGGCVLAICCDYRIMAEGDYIIGLNEIPVGIVVPESIFKVYSFWIGKQKAYQYLMEGKLIKTIEAFKIGLIDEICNTENLEEHAKRQMDTYLKFNQVTWIQSKLNLRRELIDIVNSDQNETLDLMLKIWWAPETRAGLERMVQGLKARSGNVKG
jgi:enoyl-CoA hydratase/carnithine racemase